MCCCSVLQCVAVCCSVLQCVVAVCCNECVAVGVLQCVALLRKAKMYQRLAHHVLQRVAVCCSVLQCVVVSYSVLQLVCCS